MGDDDASWVPKVDMEFESDEDAYQYYNSYARAVGFRVRKAWVNRRASGLIISRTFACYKEGYQGNKRDMDEVKKPRKNERTGCLAHLIIKITESGRYRVSEFHPMHNHEFVPDAHMLKSHRVVKSRKRNAGSQTSTIEYLVRKAGGYRQVRLVSVEDAVNESWAPKVGMEFENDEKAYQFYIEYGRRIGFDVRKAWVNRRSSGVIVSRTYVCFKEGFYGNKKDGSQVDKHKLRVNERTGCLARMMIKLSKNGRYRVTGYQPIHNHEFATARTAHMLKSHRAAENPDTGANNLVDGTRVATKASCDSVSGQVGGDQHCSLPLMQFRSSVPTKRMSFMKMGDAGAILQYMQERQVDDHSLYYAVHLDGEEHITSVFWADGKSKIDYKYFGDVICFDMTYKSSCYGRPFAPFYGVNHHKQIVFFGAALVYAETEESFRWLFQAFKTAMYEKQPRVILTDQDESVCKAISSVWQDTTYRTCVWHIYQNAIRQLSQVFLGSRTFAYDFSRCLYDCEEEEEFISSWKKLLEKYDLKDNAWLNKLFEDREKWAPSYGRESFSGDMISTQRIVNLNNMLKEACQERDILQFFDHFEKIINEHRHVELQADFYATQSSILIAPSRMLRQAANAYTPTVFEMFQREFELSMDFMVYKCGEVEAIYEYKVSNEETSKEHLVKFDSVTGTILCSCKKFEFIGIQCRHVLKTLDILNIKELPTQYLLKRWRKDAKVGSLGDNHGFASNIDSNLSKAQRYSYLCRIFGLIAAKAAETLEGYTYIENQSDQLIQSVYQILVARPPEEPPFC